MKDLLNQNNELSAENSDFEEKITKTVNKFI